MRGPLNGRLELPMFVTESMRTEDLPFCFFLVFVRMQCFLCTFGLVAACLYFLGFIGCLQPNVTQILSILIGL